MSGDKARVYFQSMFERNGRGSVLVPLHESLSKIDKAFRECRRQFGHFAIFGDGEIQVLLINHGAEIFEVTRGMRIAQLVIADVVRIQLNEQDKLDPTKRGGGGFGSTGTR